MKHTLSINQIPIQANNTYKDRIEDFTLACTPLSMNGIHLLAHEAMHVLRQCTGSCSIEDIIQSNGYSKEYVIRAIGALWQNGLIKVDNRILPQAKRKAYFLSRIETWFHITNNCNINCPYCYIKKTKESMSRETAFRAINNLIESASSHSVPSIRIKFTGGEPLLCFPLMKEVVSYGKKKSSDKHIKISFHLLTNGTLISKEVVQYLQRESISISLSLDGVAEYHNRLRCYANGAGTFKQIEKVLDLLKDYGIHPYILTTVSAPNLYGLPDFTHYLLERKLSFRFSLYRELGVVEESLRSYNDEVIKVLHQCYDIFEKNLPDRDIFAVHQLCDIKLTKSRKRACGIGSKGVNIDHEGRIAICQAVFDNPVGHVAKMMHSLLYAVKINSRPVITLLMITNIVAIVFGDIFVVADALF